MTEERAIAVWTANNPYCNEKRLETRLVDIAGHRMNIRQAWKPDGKGGTEIGYGAVIYPSSLVLAWELQHHDLKGQRVVELGCGHGLCSVTAAKMGAAQVFATDGDYKSLDLTRSNCTCNGVEDSVSVQRLLWGNVEEEAALQPPFDVVVASDVAAMVYEQYFSDLVASLVAMSSTASLILLVYERRGGAERKFFHKLAKWFSWEESQPSHPDFGEAYVGELFVLTLRRLS